MKLDFLTPEIEMVVNVLNGTKNVTAYSYEVAIKGTMADGVAGLISLLFGTVVA